MSEIADAVQIIRVTYDGIEIAMKMGSASIHSMQKALDLIVGMLEHEKEMGKTNLKGLLAKGGDIQVLSFADEDLKKFRKLAKKYGILYSEMPDADRNDGLTEVMFHSEAAPRIRMMSQKLQDGRVFNMDEYLKSGNEEKLEQLLKYLENEKNGKSPRKLHADETIRADEAEKVIGQLAKIGVLDRADDAGNYRVIMEREAFDRRLSRYQELSSRMRQIATSKNTSLLDITITKKLVAQENDRAVKTRVPGMYGQNEGYLWINRADIMEIHNGKTLLTYLDKNKEYKIYSADNRVIRTIKGEELYSGHYDRVEAAVRQRYKAARQQPAKTVERTRRR